MLPSPPRLTPDKNWSAHRKQLVARTINPPRSQSVRRVFKEKTPCLAPVDTARVKGLALPS